MNKYLTVDQLETMKVHELADLLGNIVLVLKRMPNVECRQLAAQFSPQESISSEEYSAQTTESVLTDTKPVLTEAELKNKTVSELKSIAKDLGLKLGSKPRKDECVAKIFARLNQSHSEQYAIQHL